MVLTGFYAHGRLTAMFERFTGNARQVVVRAQEEARRLHHNYIGTEHILLGLLAVPDGHAVRALEGFGLSLNGARDEVVAMVGTGKSEPTGHIPFTPRAKKTLELSLREAMQLHHHYIGTEHILLGLIREGDGVAAQVMKQHADLILIRMAVLDQMPGASTESGQHRRWLRRRNVATYMGEPETPAPEQELSATPAADSTLSQAARLAGLKPVGSHHLLLAALSDPDTAAARALAALGVDLGRATEALRSVDVRGTSDEQPEEAGRRQMVIRLTGERLTVEAADPVILKAGRAALDALGAQADPADTIRGDLDASASLAKVWQALLDSLETISRRASASAEPAQAGESAEPDAPGSPEAAER
jgi:ATP-dependent Clp protease ATP-binding subunit ClpA